MSSFRKKLEDRTYQIEQIIKSYEPEENGLQKIIFEAMNYSVNAGGKRLRPILLLETFKLFSEDEDIAYPFMAAMEMIKSPTLLIL